MERKSTAELRKYLDSILKVKEAYLDHIEAAETMKERDDLQISYVVMDLQLTGKLVEGYTTAIRECLVPPPPSADEAVEVIELLMKLLDIQRTMLEGAVLLYRHWHEEPH